jgi:hypothetical protein
MDAEADRAQPPLPTRELFSVGGALSRSFSVWSRNLPLFVGVSVALHLPLMFFPPLVSGGTRAAVMSSLFSRLGLIYLQALAQRLLGFCVAGALIYAVVEQLRGRAVDAARTLSIGVSKLLQLLWVSVTTAIMVGLAGLFGCIPGVLLGLRWLLIAPVVVVEARVGDAARDRSEALTEGRLVEIFGLLVLLAVISGVLGGGLGLLFGVRDSFLRRLLIKVIFPAAVASFQAVLYSVVYFQLRSEKEGVDIEALAAVFD